MGTRGLYGFRKNGEDKTTYNHWDSYPTVLGVEIATFVKQTSTEELNRIYDKIIMINEDESPTEEQIRECSKYENLRVSTQSENDWYCLLRETQGSLKCYKDTDLKYMIDNRDFILNSLFCEWAYIINLDTNKLEIWKGFEKSVNSNNRYGTKKDKQGYCPCNMIKEIPFEEFEYADIKAVMKEMERG